MFNISIETVIRMKEIGINYPTYARAVKLKERSVHKMKQTSMILIPTDYSFNSQSIISVHTVGVLFTR